MVLHTIMLKDEHPPRKNGVQMNTSKAVVITRSFDYEKTTTHGIELYRFALFCNLCSFCRN